MNKWMNKLLILTVLLLSMVSVSSAQLFHIQNGLIGEDVPDVTYTTLEEKDVVLAEYVKDHKAIIFFWATWCPHCRKELEQMNKNLDTFNEQQLKLVVVDLGENAQTVKRFSEKKSLKMEMFLDQDSVSEEKFDLMGVPTFFFVNKEGKVTGVKHSLPKNYMTFLNKS